jgi:hypothetical protein
MEFDDRSFRISDIRSGTTAAVPCSQAEDYNEEAKAPFISGSPYWSDHAATTG